MVPELADLVDPMLAADPIQRPTIAPVHATLMAVRRAGAAAGTAAAPGRLRGKVCGDRRRQPAGAAPRPPVD